MLVFKIKFNKFFFFFIRYIMLKFSTKIFQQSNFNEYEMNKKFKQTKKKKKYSGCFLIIMQFPKCILKTFCDDTLRGWVRSWGTYLLIIQPKIYIFEQANFTPSIRKEKIKGHLNSKWFIKSIYTEKTFINIKNDSLLIYY